MATDSATVDSDVQGGEYAGRTQFPDIWRGLAAPFATVKQRSGSGGRQLSYITARQAMNRLDAILGPENWEDEYYESHGVLFCKITVTLPDGRRISKADAGGFKEMTERGQIDQENTDKTGASDALKRAAAKFGVARYLYQDGTVDYADDGSAHEPGQGRAPAKAAPRTQQAQAKAPARRATPPPADDAAPAGEPDYGNLPQTAKHLYPWATSMEAKYRGLALVKAMNAWAKQCGLPFKQADWPETWEDGGAVLPDALDYLIHQINQFLGIEDPVVSRP